MVQITGGITISGGITLTPGSGGGGGGDTDSNFSNVSLLLNGNGTNGAQNNTFVDGSSNGYTVTENGTVIQGSFSPYSLPSGRAYTGTDGGSIYIGDNQSNYLTLSGGGFSTGSSNYTIEMWAYWESADGAALINGIDSSNNDKLYFSHVSGTYYFGDGSTNNIAANLGTPTLNTWIHYAVVKNGSTYKLYVDGVEEASTTDSLASTTIATWQVGGRPGLGDYPFPGYLSDVRIVDGTSVYTSAFTPSTSPLTAITNTSLLIQGQNSAIFDLTGKNNIDTVGNAQISTSIKKFGTGSIKFDGTGDYLEIPSSDAFDLGTDDWTIEGWIYPESDSDDRGAIFELYNDDNKVLRIMVQTSDQLEFRIESGGTRVCDIRTTNWDYDEWIHVAAVNNSGTITFYLNGTSEGTDSSFTMPDFSSARVLLGMDLLGTDRWYTGYIDDFRVTKGVARYTSNFTAPSSAHPTS